MTWCAEWREMRGDTDAGIDDGDRDRVGITRNVHRDNAPRAV
jgi:hypothetical protein